MINETMITGAAAIWIIVVPGFVGGIICAKYYYSLLSFQIQSQLIYQDNQLKKY